MKHKNKPLFVYVIIGLCHIFLIGYSILFAGEKQKIILINSNASVEKYRVVQEEFKKSISLPVREVNLEGTGGENINVKELLSDNAALIYCIGSKAYSFAREYYGDKDIVFSSIINCRRLPMSAKTYGVSNELNARMPLFMYRSLFPGMKKIGVLYSKKFSLEWFESTRDQAKELDISIIGKEVNDEKSTESALNQMLPDVNAFWVISDPVVMPEKDYLYKILEICDKKKIPVFSYNDAFAELGATLIVSVDDPTIGRQAAGLAIEVLSKSSMEDKIQFPAGSSVTLNLKKVETYKIEYNKNALGAVNSIIK